MTRKKFKIAPTPKECKFLIEEDCYFKSKKERENVIKSLRFQECLKKLNELP